MMTQAFEEPEEEQRKLASGKYMYCDDPGHQRITYT